MSTSASATAARPCGPSIRATAPWINQGYVWAATSEGVLKAGAIWRRFGLDWDGSWYGNVPYYDGLMLATGLGISWEDTRKISDDFKVDRFFQFFFHDYLDYSLVAPTR